MAALQSPKLSVGVRVPGGMPINVKVAERPNARVCKTLKPSVRIRPFTPNNAAVAQLVEYLLAKQDVTGSNPVSRSKQCPSGAKY